jgi:hypothetical protein
VRPQRGLDDVGCAQPLMRTQRVQDRAVFGVKSGRNLSRLSKIGHVFDCNAKECKQLEAFCLGDSAYSWTYAQFPIRSVDPPCMRCG